MRFQKCRLDADRCLVVDGRSQDQVHTAREHLGLAGMGNGHSTGEQTAGGSVSTPEGQRVGLQLERRLTCRAAGGRDARLLAECHLVDTRQTIAVRIGVGVGRILIAGSGDG